MNERRDPRRDLRLGGQPRADIGERHGISRDEPVFQISIVSRMVGLHQQTIRQYERVGLIRPARSGGNTRLFSHADVERLRQVVRLVSDLGVNLAGVEVILRMGRQIEELRARLDAAQEELARLRGADDARDTRDIDRAGGET